MESSTYILLSGIGAMLLAFLLHQIRYRLAVANIKRKNGCLEPRIYPHKDPIFGHDLFLSMGKAMKAGKLLETTQKLFNTYGKTFQVNSWGTTTIYTSESTNIQTVLASSFKNFGVMKIERRTPGGSIMAEGIFSADGPVWARSRGLIRPTFARSEISNFNSLEKHVSRFIELIPVDGLPVDLQPLLKHLFLDISTEFLFGESVDSQLPDTPFDSVQFLQAFDTSMSGLAARMMLGKLKFIRGFDTKWKAANKTVLSYVDRHVSRVLKERPDFKLDSEDGGQKKYILLNEMAKETQDPIDLRYQLINVFFPAHDSTGIAISDIFFHLARDPERWEKLRAEVLTMTASRPLTFELLKSMNYLRYVFNESLRLHPTAPIIRRICHQDTILPHGGGPNGQSPILVRKGENVVLNLYTLHRDKDIWGEDANEFRPERWETARPTWEYLPFSGGPRICPAQQMVFTDAAYIIVRVIQQFARIENQDPRPWAERFRLTVENRNGVKVKMVQS
ncbi:cytochrome P450 alkane hydroxylase-like protein [Mollisia scopiformis]|uniref:Cytochrome P450 alkane hydroxylase-like protein n=1 Tax=Mollisia scopiformis TaxID=149040 RepID=A0A194XN46_MOLSC|nr:cytochrome P450 alkane hydroxylase-like protein [Mollisia scopiformis]KUJ21588.1 cytochrome P450 alkane hydroxylase-like protein [Mollisia scopiformis]